MSSKYTLPESTLELEHLRYINLCKLIPTGDIEDGPVVVKYVWQADEDITNFCDYTAKKYGFTVEMVYSKLDQTALWQIKEVIDEDKFLLYKLSLNNDRPNTDPTIF
jgi:hypothetical protein